MIAFTCSECGKTFRVPDQYAGRSAKCKICGNTVTVPATPDAEPELVTVGVAEMDAAGIAMQVARRGQPFAAPCVLLSGSETTVRVRGDGRGGRNVEFLRELFPIRLGHRRRSLLRRDSCGTRQR